MFQMHDAFSQFIWQRCWWLFVIDGLFVFDYILAVGRVFERFNKHSFGRATNIMLYSWPAISILGVWTKLGLISHGVHSLGGLAGETLQAKFKWLGPSGLAIIIVGCLAWALRMAPLNNRCSLAPLNNRTNYTPRLFAFISLMLVHLMWFCTLTFADLARGKTLFYGLDAYTFDQFIGLVNDMGPFGLVVLVFNFIAIFVLTEAVLQYCDICRLELYTVARTRRQAGQEQSQHHSVPASYGRGRHGSRIVRRPPLTLDLESGLAPPPPAVHLDNRQEPFPDPEPAVKRAFSHGPGFKITRSGRQQPGPNVANEAQNNSSSETTLALEVGSADVTSGSSRSQLPMSSRFWSEFTRSVEWSPAPSRTPRPDLRISSWVELSVINHENFPALDGPSHDPEADSTSSLHREFSFSKSSAFTVRHPDHITIELREYHRAMRRHHNYFWPGCGIEDPEEEVAEGEVKVGHAVVVEGTGDHTSDQAYVFAQAPEDFISRD